MTNNPGQQFRNDASPTDKLATLLNDKRVLRQNDSGTFLSHTHTDEGGRFAKPQHVVGATPAPEYPRQPEGSFSNQSAIVPPEESLGFSIDEVPIIGEPHEVAASLQALGAVGDAPASTEPHSSLSATAEQPASPGDATPTETGSDPTVPSQELVASPNPNQQPLRLNKRKPT